MASSARDGTAGATLTYGVPGASAARHVVYDAPEASDGTSVVTAVAQSGRCAITITAGSGHGFTGHPLMFQVSTASDGCKAADGTDVPPGTPPPGGGVDGGPDGGVDGGPDGGDDGAPDVLGDGGGPPNGGGGKTGGCGCVLGGASARSAAPYLLAIAAVAATLRGRRGRRRT